MPQLLRLRYTDSIGRARFLRFLEEAHKEKPGCRMTVITGKNGSHKSTILRDLVAALTIPSHKDSLELLGQKAPSTHVLCISGAVVDRFPSKEATGTRSSEFDVPNYSYLGQRVGPNLLSKKRPLETVIAFALDEAVDHRFKVSLFRHAFGYAGVEPYMRLTLQPKRPSKAETGGRQLHERLQLVASGTELPRDAGVRSSSAMAKFLLKEFGPDQFREVERWLSGELGRRIKVAISPVGIVIEPKISNQALRLAMLSDQATLVDADVVPAHGKEQSWDEQIESMIFEDFGPAAERGAFSVFDLSSGEYHMLTTLLGLGLGVRKDSVVLIDEPENSLHPQWQQEFMARLIEISKLLPDGHIVISTHSPLIVSSAGPASIVDLGQGDDIEPISNRYGASANDILLDRFGIASSRDPQVIDVVQRAVALVEAGQITSEEFRELEARLSSIRAALAPDDPLIEVLSALLDGEG